MKDLVSNIMRKIQGEGREGTEEKEEFENNRIFPSKFEHLIKITT